MAPTTRAQSKLSPSQAAEAVGILKRCNRRKVKIIVEEIPVSPQLPTPVSHLSPFPEDNEDHDDDIEMDVRSPPSRRSSWGSDLTTIAELDEEMEMYEHLRVKGLLSPGPFPVPTAPPSPDRKPLQRACAVDNFDFSPSPSPNDMSIEALCTPHDLANYPDAKWEVFPPANEGGNPVYRVRLVPDDHSPKAKDKQKVEEDQKKLETMRKQLLKIFAACRLTLHEVVDFINDPTVREALNANDASPMIQLPSASRSSLTSSTSSTSTLVRSDTEFVEPPSPSPLINPYREVQEVPTQMIDGRFTSAPYRYLNPQSDIATPGYDYLQREMTEMVMD